MQHYTVNIGYSIYRVLPTVQYSNVLYDTGYCTDRIGYYTMIQ